jgi:two-component system, chemotaxis family, protein-glutamate methylesterase/glutaminase
LRQESETRLLTYRCHTGHQFSAIELLSHQHDEVEGAVMAAVRVLNERAELCRRMIDDARAGGRSHGVLHWRRLADESEQQLEILLRFLSQPRQAELDEEDAEPLELKAGE